MLQLVKNEGYRVLFNGYWPTFWRDVPGWAIYFYSYELQKAIYERHRSKENSTKGKEFMFRLCAGGNAGIISWIISFPFDVVKTEMMCSS